MLKSWLIYVLLLAAVLAGLGGFTLDAVSFGSNLLAETWGVLVSVVLAFTLLDSWSRRQRQLEWQRVSLQTARSLHAHLMEIGNHCFWDRSLFDDDHEFFAAYYNEGSPSEASAKALSALSQLINERIEQLSSVREARIETVESQPMHRSRERGYHYTTMLPDGSVIVPDEQSRREFASSELDRASTRAIRDSADADLVQIRNVLTPRVLQLASDSALTETLLELEERERKWTDTLHLVEGWGAPEQFAWEDLASFIDAAAAVVRHMTQEASTRSLGKDHSRRGVGAKAAYGVAARWRRRQP